MSRNPKLFLEDILGSCEKVLTYTDGKEFDSFKKDSMLIDAVLRNLEIIGEATRKVPESFREKHPEIEWRKLAGFRDIAIHEYFGIDLDIVWDIVGNKVPHLKDGMKKILSS